MTEGFQFYSSLMMLSAELRLVAMLDDYVAPEPVVADFVREQLFRGGSSRAVRQAVERHRQCKKPRAPGELYQQLLSYSGLDFNGKNPALANAISSGLLYGHLFDLSLGHYVKASKMWRYTEFDSVRQSISRLVSEWVRAGMACPGVGSNSLWWDGQYEIELHCRRWIPEPMGKDPGFYAVFDSWLEDSSHLQDQLERYEKNTKGVNNPDDVNRVLPESVAIKALELAQVRASQRRLS